jgi:DNA-binding PadR family transcriptional regulator
MRSATPQTLTELESCTLGVIWELQPCSTYQVRRAFAQSPTTEWSASAGTLYPVIARLVHLKLVRAQVRRGDSRGRRDLHLTTSGERALRHWVVRLEPAHASSTPDPVRSRMHFLAVVEKRRRAALLARAERLTRAAIEETRGFLSVQRQHSELDYLAGLGGLYQLEARLRWLRFIARKLGYALR